MSENAKTFFTEADKLVISQSIASAEKSTSGEIRVHLENHCKGDALLRAQELFEKLKMSQTAGRTGILFYLAVKDHQFAIFGDKGINEKVPDHFWDGIKDHMMLRFKDGRFTDGLCEGIGMAGEQLKKHFPVSRDDRNELENEVSHDL